MNRVNSWRLSKKIFLVLICFFAVSRPYAQTCYVFFGSYNWDKSTEGIYVYQLDPLSGNLTRVTAAKNILNPSYLTLSPDGRFVYACTESKTPGAGSVSSFAFHPESHSLTFINSQPSGGENPVYLTVHPNGKWLVNGNYTEGSVSVYPLLANGAIDSMAQHFRYAEASVSLPRQDRSHIHSTVFSPDGNYIFIPDLGADKIRCYVFDGTQEQPLQTALVPYTPSEPASGPRHFTFHPNGRFAYCIEELSGTVAVYAYENGRLDSIQRVNTHPPKYHDGFESSDIHLSPDGRFLYASNRGKENNLAIFSVAENGLLKPIGYPPTHGNHPRTFAMDPTGRFIIVTHAVSGNVTVFRRNTSTGLLKKVGKKVLIRNVSGVQMRYY